MPSVTISIQCLNRAYGRREVADSVLNLVDAFRRRCLGTAVVTEWRELTYQTRAQARPRAYAVREAVLYPSRGADGA